jgi:hypothetical protein
MQMGMLGNPIKAEARGIYICNHALPLDIFLVIWLTPAGTVGIAKKEVSIYHFSAKSPLSPHPNSSSQLIVSF